MIRTMDIEESQMTAEAGPRWRLAADARNTLGEGPVWCPQAQALWWIDVSTPSLWRLAAAGRLDSWPLPKPPGTFALLQDGSVLIAFRSGLARFELGAPLRWLDLPALALADDRFNDGKVDRAGRFWIGTMDRALTRPVGRLYRMNGLQRIDEIDAGFPLSNGIAWSPDNRAMYFAETYEQRIYCYDFDVATGQASNRRVLVQLSAGHPDGLTVDAEGGIWCALFEAGRIDRYRPDGSLDRSLDTPVSRPTSCMFGGQELHTLYVTTARHGLSDAQLAAEPWTGGVIAIDVAERGIPEPRMVEFDG
jgi:sugar lactone lactonase YvrE